jgi:antitoxin (DNA-binding transcriptional repressor) of toxin-antitoxin stability system
MPVHGIHYTKTHLSELVRMVEHGEVITITRNQAPVALLLRIGAVPQPRRSGTLRALMRLDAALDDESATSETPALSGTPADSETPGPSGTPAS